MSLSSRCLPESFNNIRHPALVAGHPGHELRVFGWMSACRPRVYLISDGSGSQGIARTSSSAAAIAQLGCERGEIFGAISDATVYCILREGNPSLFLRLVDQMASSFVKHEIDFVAGDAAEGFNPTHDLCRTLINAAVTMAERASGRAIANFEFCLTEWEDNCPDLPHDHRCIHLVLDDNSLSQKLTAAEGYIELKEETQRAIDSRGEEYFRVECLRRVTDPAWPLRNSARRLYEIWGETRVAEGKYQSVIRFKEHVLPVLTSILDYAASADLSRSAAFLDN
ncbi:MAG TPA: hypothetical protein VKY85_25360 [Candidatus Angelobacter sp.]|nr:hypothetical protein [Candidatus Angelobacter sp.]